MDGDLIREVRSQSVRETWTQYDVELASSAKSFPRKNAKNCGHGQ
jgi:hypothetical protein